MDTLITNLKGLVLPADAPLGIKAGKALADLPVLENAFLHLREGKFFNFGTMEDLDESQLSPDCQTQDASGQYAMPGFVDSHTHLVYAEPRAAEFEDRLRGMSYEEIAKRGGGILNSAKKLQQTSESQLFESAMERVHEIIGTGTVAVEVKSGYGLTVADELKMLRVVARLKEEAPIRVKATFLGAHAFPKEVSREAYMRQILDEMLPQVAAEGLAEYVDVFCDRGFFTPEETAEILDAGAKYGLRPKVHANELDYSGGVQVGVKYKARSVDHLECVGDAEIKALQEGETLPTLLPGTAFFLGLEYPPARKLIEAGLPVTLASDYNPGSCPTGNMPFIVSLACLKLKMLPQEALNAAIVNAAHALDLGDEYGCIRKGAAAHFFLTPKMNSLAFFPYAFGSERVREVFLHGKKV